MSLHTRDYRLLDYFVAIVEEGSLASAAQKLNVSSPVVSKALSDLEKTLNVSLLIRGSREQRLTEAGTQVLRSARMMQVDAINAMDVAQDTNTDIEGQIAVSLPSELTLNWLPDKLSSFATQQPKITFAIYAQDQEQDLAQSGHDIAIRAVFRFNGCRNANSFSTLPLALVCSPDWIETPNLNLQSQLNKIPFIGFTFRSNNYELGALCDKTGQRTSFSMNPRHSINSGFFGKEMALMGEGVALVLAQSIEGDVDQGRLVQLGKNYNFGVVDLSLIIRDKLPSPATRAFTRYLN